MKGLIMRNVWLTILLLAIFPIMAGAQVERETQESVKVYFRQGETKFDLNYKDNGVSLRKYAEEIKAYQQDTLVNFRQVRIVASVSPEGTTQANERVARLRAKSIVDWINQEFSEQFDYTVESSDIDWNLLIELISNNERVPYKEEVLDVLHHTPTTAVKNGRTVNERYNRLRALRGGEPYQWIYTHLFPELRYAVAKVEIWWKVQPKLTLASSNQMNFPDTGGEGNINYIKNVPDGVLPVVTSGAAWIELQEPTASGVRFKVLPNTMEQPRSTVITLQSYGVTHQVTVNQQAAPPPPAPEPELVVEPVRKPLYIAVKNNLLYDVALVPNIGVEYYLGKDWSVVANWQYAWWKSDRKSWYWRVYGGDVAVRRWFGKAAAEKPLTGHHAGIYAQMITYDFETGGRGYLADRWSWTAGVEYGYSMPIARRFNIDFTLGVGYHWGEYKEYIPIDNHYVWQATKQRKFFGPTKAEVSLVWLLGYGNYNSKKGGKQ